MPDSYYPRHGGEQSPGSEELHIAWLEDRVEFLTHQRDEARAALRTVAEAQREACAARVMKFWGIGENSAEVRAVRATPLVTEVEK
jgi:hypothetical protein